MQTPENQLHSIKERSPVCFQVSRNEIPQYCKHNTMFTPATGCADQWHSYRVF